MRLFCVVLAIGTMTGLSLNAQPRPAGGIEAIVHDSIITTYQVNQVLEEFPPELIRQNYEGLRQEKLEQLLENRLILREFELAGYNLPETVIDEILQDHIRTRYGDRVRFIRTIHAQGKTSEQYRKEFRDHFIIEQMRLMRNSKQTIISPYKIETYYNQHKDQFKVPDQVNLQTIVLPKTSEEPERSRKQAEEILAQIREKRATFAEMQSLYSQRKGGWYEISRLLPELREPASKLNAGEVSDVIETDDATYLVFVEEKRPEHVRALNDVRDEIEKTLLDQERTRLQKQWIERLKKKTFVRYF